MVSNQKLLRHVHENNSRIVSATLSKEISDDENQFIPGLMTHYTAAISMLENKGYLSDQPGG
jgi:hypothetical protein